MPRYFFHVADGEDLPDEVGTILPNTAAARVQAIATAGAMLADRGPTFWGGTEWRMTVVNEAGVRVCLLRFSAE